MAPIINNTNRIAAIPINQLIIRLRVLIKVSLSILPDGRKIVLQAVTDGRRAFLDSCKPQNYLKSNLPANVIRQRRELFNDTGGIFPDL